MLNKTISVKKWLKYLGSIVILMIVFLFTFNFIIDPYGKQNYFCNIKYKPVLNERGKKYSYIFYDKHINNYDSLILGSSRVMQIITSNSKLTKSFYNFGVHVANNAEKLFILQEWLKVKKLKTVYLGIDYYNFHKNKRPLYVDYGQYQNSNNSNYLSINTLKLSYKSLLNQIYNAPQTFFNEDGSINYFNNDKLISENKFDFSKNKFILQSRAYVKTHMIDDPFIIEEKVFDKLIKIKELSLKYNFKLHIFITPMQQEVLNVLKKYPNIKDKFRYIDKKLTTIFGNIYNFSIKNKYNQNRKNFYDSYHYRSVLGDKIISRINGLSNDYGKIE